jgi:hypothetical protein
MENNILQKISEDNLCTYFVLPLLKLSKIRFINSNFVNAYLTRQGREIVIKVYDLTMLSRAVYTHPNYKGTYYKDGFFYVAYEIPRNWRRDIELFMQGKYSRMSKQSHTMILTYSSLDYRKRTSDYRTVTDGRLLALTRSPILRKMWVKEFKLSETALDDDDELLPGFDERSCIDLHDLKKYP